MDNKIKLDKLMEAYLEEADKHKHVKPGAVIGGAAAGGVAGFVAPSVAAGIRTNLKKNFRVAAIDKAHPKLMKKMVANLSKKSKTLGVAGLAIGGGTGAAISHMRNRKKANVQEGLTSELDKLMEAYMQEGIGSTIKQGVKKLVGKKPFKLTSGGFEAKGATTLKGTLERVKALAKKKLRK